MNRAPESGTSGSDTGPTEKPHLKELLKSIAAKRLAVEWLPFRNPRLEEETELKRTLRSTPLFEGLSARQWRLMTDLFHIRYYDPGEVIFEQGTPGLGMYVIVDGKVRIITRENGEEITLAQLSDGDFFGEMSLIDEVERSAGAVSIGRTKLVGLFRPQLRDLMNHKPRLGIILFERLARIVVQRLRRSNEQLLQQIQDLATLEAEVVEEQDS